jgi:hypothetical protein
VSSVPATRPAGHETDPAAIRSALSTTPRPQRASARTAALAFEKKQTA